MKHVEKKLAAFLAGEMTPVAAAAVQRHLDECRSCRAELETLRGVWAALEVAAPAAGTAPTLWPAIRRRTFGAGAGAGAGAGVGAERAAWFFGRGGLSRVGLAATAVAAGLVLGVWAPGGGSGGGEAADAQAEATALDATLLTSTWLKSTWLDAAQESRLSDLWLSAGQSEDATDGTTDDAIQGGNGS